MQSYPSGKLGQILQSLSIHLALSWGLEEQNSSCSLTPGLKIMLIGNCLSEAVRGGVGVSMYTPIISGKFKKYKWQK